MEKFENSLDDLDLTDFTRKNSYSSEYKEEYINFYEDFSFKKDFEDLYEDIKEKDKEKINFKYSIFSLEKELEEEEKNKENNEINEKVNLIKEKLIPKSKKLKKYWGNNDKYIIPSFFKLLQTTSTENHIIEFIDLSSKKKLKNSIINNETNVNNNLI